MSTKSDNEFVFFIPVQTAKTNDFKSEAVKVSRALDPDTGGHRTFDNVILSADGNEPATHRGVHGWATAEFKQQVQAFKSRAVDIVPPVQAQYEPGGRFESLQTPARGKVEEVRDEIIIEWGMAMEVAASKHNLVVIENNEP